MDLKALYRDVILDHNKTPRLFGKLEPADSSADGHNPLCGDRLHVTLRLDGDRVSDLRFEGKGCAISTASASLMTEAVKGKDKAVAQATTEGHEHEEDMMAETHRHDEAEDALVYQLVHEIVEELHNRHEDGTTHEDPPQLEAV